MKDVFKCNPDESGGVQGTHWDGCWHAHLDCAVNRCIELERRLLAIQDVVVYADIPVRLVEEIVDIANGNRDTRYGECIDAIVGTAEALADLGDTPDE